MLETYLISLIPAVSSVIGIIASVIVAVKKIKKSNAETEINVKNVLAEVKKEKEENKLLKTQLQVAISNNATIAQELSEIKAKLNHIHVKKEK
ncbi:MAG: hypothetical protein J6W16_03490 [Methanobrevibacter sp.]|nr:hypothetical protein [Methanobrevibacter sp.]